MKYVCLSLLTAALVAAFSCPVAAQGDGDHSFATPGNATVGGSVIMCLNTSNKAVPCSSGSTGTGIAITGSAVTLTDRSGTIALGGTAQTLMAANPTRHGCHIQNISAGDLWFNPKGAAAIANQPSTWLPVGSDYVCPTTGASSAAFSILGSTTGQAFTAEEW